MKNLVQMAIMITMVSVFAACNTQENKDKKKTESSSVKKTDQPASAAMYTCRMHPEVTTNKPGKCPKCNMDLVKTEGSEMQPDSNHQGHSH